MTAAATGANLVGVVDYRAGNLKSVETALRHVGARFFVSGDPERIRTADRLVFPGVGEAQAAMRVLTETGLGEAIVEFAASGRPLLGICLGCQVILDASDEAPEDVRKAGGVRCLGLLPGTVKRFPAGLGLKVPHMGWNSVASVVEREGEPHAVLQGIPEGSSFYFVHSFYPDPQVRSSVIARTEYGVVFASGIARENIVAFQFHPEKSGPKGLRLLANFLEWNL